MARGGSWRMAPLAHGARAHSDRSQTSPSAPAPVRQPYGLGALLRMLRFLAASINPRHSLEVAARHCAARRVQPRRR
jgi:hypothetical protein